MLFERQRSGREQESRPGLEEVHLPVEYRIDMRVEQLLSRKSLAY